MAIVKCKECGNEISSNAKKCPNCGNPIKRKSGCFIVFIILFAIILIANIISFLSGNNFEEVGYFKKETPNGSNCRVYSVYVKDFSDTPEMWDSILKYAKNKMYTQGGTTMVFFFNDKLNTPDVSLVGADFDQKYNKYCIADYWKYPNGKEKLNKFPFK